MQEPLSGFESGSRKPLISLLQLDSCKFPESHAFCTGDDVSQKYLLCVLCDLDSLAEGEPMIRKTRLFTPGPTPLLPAAQFAMAAADMHHRTPEFRALFQKVLAQLKTFVGT